jgi:hypothetical protein
MPGARRVRKGQTQVGKDAQVRNSGAGQGGGGPDNFDGTKNTNAGTPKDQPKQFNESGRVIKYN